MATCKDCIHYDVCYHIEHYGRHMETEEPCGGFKNKADHAEVIKCVKCKFADDSCAYGLVCICEHGGMQGTIVSKRDYCSCGTPKERGVKSEQE